MPKSVPCAERKMLEEAVIRATDATHRARASAEPERFVDLATALTAVRYAVRELEEHTRKHDCKT